MPSVEAVRGMLTEAGIYSKNLKYGAEALMALCGLTPTSEFKEAQSTPLTVRKGIMEFMAKFLGGPYSENTRESIRKGMNDLYHQGVLAKNIHNAPPRSPLFAWGVTPEALHMVRSYGSDAWPTAVKAVSGVDVRASQLEQMLTVQDPNGDPLVNPADGKRFLLPDDAHGRLEAAIIERLGPDFFGATAQVAYVDASLTGMNYVDDTLLRSVGIRTPKGGWIPDVVFVEQHKQVWFVEAVVTSGHVTPGRARALEAEVAPDIAVQFATCFPSRQEARDIGIGSFASGSEVWFADGPGRQRVAL